MNGILLCDVAALGGPDAVKILLHMPVWEDGFGGPVEAYAGDPALLSAADRFVLDVVVGLPRARQKLVCMDFLCQTDELATACTSGVAALASASEEARCCDCCCCGGGGGGAVVVCGRARRVMRGAADYEQPQAASPAARRCAPVGEQAERWEQNACARAAARAGHGGAGYDRGVPCVMRLGRRRQAHASGFKLTSLNALVATRANNNATLLDYIATKLVEQESDVRARGPWLRDRAGRRECVCVCVPASQLLQLRGDFKRVIEASKLSFVTVQEDLTKLKRGLAAMQNAVKVDRWAAAASRVPLRCWCDVPPVPPLQRERVWGGDGRRAAVRDGAVRARGGGDGGGARRVWRGVEVRGRGP